MICVEFYGMVESLRVIACLQGIPYSQFIEYGRVIFLPEYFFQVGGYNFIGIAVYVIRTRKTEFGGDGVEFFRILEQGFHKECKHVVIISVHHIVVAHLGHKSLRTF